MDDSELDRILKSWDFRSLLNLKLDEHLYGIINELLCNYSKEYTSIRKLNEAIQDTFNAFNSKLAESAVDMGLGYFDATYSSVGSRGEGLGLLANDTDLLCVSNRTKVCLPMPDFDPDINTLIMEMDHCHQGYCKLKLHRNNLFDAVDNLPRSEIVRKHRNIYVKNTHFVGRFHDKNVAFHGWYWEGPALKDYDTKQDWVIALQCMNSSHLYKAYFQRTRRWPNVDMTEHMKNIPCSVVCAHHASSDAPLEEYRISFARAEKYLMRNVSHVQMACYFTLKEVVKNHVEDILSDDFDEDENDIFKTYYIKTVFLWCSERTDPKIWTDDNFLRCTILCISYLQQCYELQIIPHLFIPENNLIDHLSTQECLKVAKILNELTKTDCLKNMFGCFCRPEFSQLFDSIIVRPGKNLKKKLVRLMRRTSTSSYDLEYIRSLLVSDTLSFISGTLSVRHEHVFCPVLYEIISDLEHYISSDLIQTLSPLFLRFLGDVVHRYPRVIRSHLKSAEECFLKGMNVVYSFGEFNDNGFSGKTHLARFHYLNGDYSKVLDLFPNFENEICLNPFIDLSILFVVDDLSRTWRDTFLCDLIKMFAYDEGSIAMPVRCIAMSLYMICNCLQMLSSTGIIIQKRTTRRLLKDSRKYDKKLKSVFITDIDATLKIVKQSKYILLKL